MDQIRLKFLKALPFLGVFALGVMFQMIVKLPNRDWYDETTPVRGDRVVLREPHAFYSGCEMIYLAGQAVSNRNESWVLLKGCKNIKENTVTDIFDSQSLVRVK